MNRLFLSAVVALGLFQPTVGLSNSLEAKVSDVVTPFLKETGIPSVSYTFFDNKGIIISNAHGRSDLKSNKLADKNTFYNVGSNFKIFTAVAVMQMVEQGHVKLDDPVIDHLPSTIPELNKYPDNPIKIKHLLNHLSGITTGAWLSKAWRPQDYYTKEKLYNSILVTETPGTVYQYCNICYSIAADIVEFYAKQAFEDFIFENILRPAGIEHRGFLYPKPYMYSDMAFPYNVRFGQAYITDFYISTTKPAGGAWFRSEDLANALRFIFSKRKLSALTPKSVDVLTTEYSKIENYDGGYGLGVGIEHYPSGTYLFHQGSLPGYISQFIFDTSSGKGLVISANATANQETADQTVWLRNQLFSMVVPEFEFPDKNYEIKPEKRSPLSEVEQEILPSAEGKYFSSELNVFMEIQKVGDQLVFKNPVGQSFNLARLSEEFFILTTENESLKITFKNEKPASLTFLSSSGNPMVSLNFFESVQ
ncbi:serine hydrolase domain-containing protein [Alteromonas oceanisediminis]|uniref:serine hydrolase domain-containing protein n=1 Tax=Alteromonas oceanisediminis TaxID=2836180 RepID=UPI001BDB5596|nr:serine hydrolase domain-containing protein [Alteromonas oceanisediminis]MBT0586139.1 beta-lactamase family protein [Alteromonas oceanisediminis]